MKKVILFVVILIGVLLLWYGESRKFICLNNGTCITVWKTFGNTCYIIPGKYYGITSPSVDHIRTTNTTLIDLYFSKSLPNTVIYRSTDSAVVKNAHPEVLVFADYISDMNRYQDLLFEDAGRQKLKEDADLIFIDIHDSHSVDKHKNRLW
ncbi:MAG TPA: hypothetical protein VIK80_09745 [Flavihumibacter sp.]